MFLEHTAEMLWIFKAEVICHLRNAGARHKPVFGESHYVFADEIAGVLAGGFFHQVAEII